MTADPPGLDAAIEAIGDRLNDLGVEGRDEEGTLDGSLWLDGLESVAEDLARCAAPALRAGALREAARELRRQVEEGLTSEWRVPAADDLDERADRIGGTT